MIAWSAPRTDALVVESTKGPIVALFVDYLSGEPEAGDTVSLGGCVFTVRSVENRRRYGCLDGSKLPRGGGAQLMLEHTEVSADRLREQVRDWNGGPVVGERHV